MPFEKPRWKNFQIWRKKLPHWRSDGVTYYVTFRHSRALNDRERDILFAYLLKPTGRRWDVMILGVLPERTELIFNVRNSATGRPFELSKIVERAKKQAGKTIIKKSKERWPPFYQESFDRIIRDEDELREKWLAILEGPAASGHSDDETFSTIFVSESI